MKKIKEVFLGISDAEMLCVQDGNVIGTVQAVTCSYDEYDKKGVAGNVVFNSMNYNGEPFDITIKQNNRNITIKDAELLIEFGEDENTIMLSKNLIEKNRVFVAKNIIDEVVESKPVDDIWTQVYTSFGGADFVCVADNRIIGEIQGVCCDEVNGIVEVQVMSFNTITDIEWHLKHTKCIREFYANEYGNQITRSIHISEFLGRKSEIFVDSSSICITFVYKIKELKDFRRFEGSVEDNL